jgi:hypothetical protein
MTLENTSLCPLSAKIARRRQRQQRDSRQQSLLLKAHEMSTLCGAEVFLGIRIKETGRVTTFCSNDAEIWKPFLSCLVFNPECISEHISEHHY